ncbi:MAG: putative sulfate/molybdate transporter, partial [Methanoregulaceae archaeon]|nr:putative sulfate/molybdate transporter [Methanoregulaceae archaeon]
MEQKILPAAKFNLSELAGAVGDFGTIIPLMFAVAAVCDLNLGVIFLFFGIWFVITGAYYRLPVPVEPMKVIAVVAISAELGGAEIAAAGLLLGILFLVLGFGKWMFYIRKYVPESVVRGIQLGLALLLLRSSGEFMLRDPWVFAAGAGLILLVFLGARLGKVPDISSLVLHAAAVVAGIFIQGVPEIHLIQFQGLVIPGLADLNLAFIDLVLPQALITVTNAIL